MPIRRAWADIHQQWADAVAAAKDLAKKYPEDIGGRWPTSPR
jgi:hypothetical protein